MVITVISPGASKMPPHDGNVAKFTYATSLTVRDTTGILAGWHLLIDSMKQLKQLKQCCAIISISFAASSFSGSGLPQCLPRDRLEMASAEPENATTLQSGIYFDEKERLVYCL